MNLPYIQSEIFRELVGIETLLKPRYFMFTSKVKHLMFTELFRDHKGTTPKSIAIFKIDCRTIKKTSDITAEINRIWQEIPTECKREDVLK